MPFQKKEVRPSRENAGAPARPERVPIADRNVQTVGNQDPAFYYRWVVDYGTTGERIQRFKEAGYILVESGEVTVGDKNVYTTEEGTSVVRKACGGGQWQFLMKLPRNLWEQDQKAKQEDIDKTEESMKYTQSGFYLDQNTNTNIKIQ